MTVLIDLGNTALKWSTTDNLENPHTIVHGGTHAFAEKLLAQMSNIAGQTVYGCSVASRDLRLSVSRIIGTVGANIQWLGAQERFEGDFVLVNRYKNPYQLGPDRWYAALGAASFLPQKALLVVHVGTATTVDCVFPQGNEMVFAGGRIAPGVGLMRDSLVSGTATLPKADGEYEDFPTDTRTAIVTGIVDSQLGLIERGMRVMQKHGFDPTLIIAGGAAGRFFPYLHKEFPQSILKHNLVLRGLSLRAHSGEG